jgi:hypothetical protein
LIFQGWRLDPILLLCQILSSGTAIFFIGESLWLRNTNIINTQAAQKNNKTQEKINLKQSIDLSPFSGSMMTEYFYQDMKVLGNEKKNLYWQTLNYTLPLSYDK